MLAACGCPRQAGGGPASTDRLTVVTAQGLCFRKDLARGRRCICGTLRGNVGWDRKVLPQNTVGSAPVPAFPYPTM